MYKKLFYNQIISGKFIILTFAIFSILMKNYLQLLRVEQWVKNVFVFIPLFFSGNFLDFSLFMASVFGFLVFSLAASSIYIFNDYLDIASDREHPEKCRRPLASGAVSKASAKLLFAILLILCALMLGAGQWGLDLEMKTFALIILLYILMNIAYSIKLKHIAVVDVSTIAFGFVLRVFAGGSITGIPVSQWAVLLTFVLALVLAVGKRRGELIAAQTTGKTRKALYGYNLPFADTILALSSTLTVVCYVIFTFSPEVQQRFHQRIFYTIFFVIFAVLRYLQLILVYNSTEPPAKILFRDRYIQMMIIGWLAVFMLHLYFNEKAESPLENSLRTENKIKR